MSDTESRRAEPLRDGFDDWYDRQPHEQDGGPEYGSSRKGWMAAIDAFEEAQAGMKTIAYVINRYDDGEPAELLGYRRSLGLARMLAHAEAERDFAKYSRNRGIYDFRETLRRIDINPVEVSD